ncbi:MAG: phospholipase D-like domain-containing protein [Ignavibacteria bacterium]
MFIFSDPDLIKAVIAAKQRGVNVKVMLNPARRDGEEENKQTRKALEDIGIEVKDSNPDFGITHEKSMVADDDVIKSLLTGQQKILILLETMQSLQLTSMKSKKYWKGFLSDWNRQKYEPGDNAHLIWCRGNGRDRIARLIDGANHSLFVQNERYQDSVIIERLMPSAV